MSKQRPPRTENPRTSDFLHALSAFAIVYLLADLIGTLVKLLCD